VLAVGVSRGDAHLDGVCTSKRATYGRCQVGNKSSWDGKSAIMSTTIGLVAYIMGTISNVLGGAIDMRYSVPRTVRKSMDTSKPVRRQLTNSGDIDRRASLLQHDLPDIAK